MSYVDFKVLVRAGAGGGFDALVFDSPYGLMCEPLKPYDPSRVEAALEQLAAQLTSFMKEPEAPAPRRALQQSQRALGAELRAFLLGGEKVAERYNRSRGRVDALAEAAPRAGLRLHVAFDPLQAETRPLAALPWELLYEEGAPGFLGLGSQLSIVRYLESQTQIKPLTVKGRLKVLLVDSAPENCPPLQLAEEIRHVTEKLGQSSQVQVSRYSASGRPDFDQLRDDLMQSPVHVLHFMGHGGFDPATGEGTIAFVREDGQDRPVTGALLAAHLRGVPELKLVVLSTCYGATLPRRCGQDPFSSVAAALIGAEVPAVVAMQFPISDPAAIAFSGAFYQALARGEPIDVAVANGRLGIRRNEETALEWATPALFMRVHDNRLFKFADNVSGSDVAPADRCESAGDEPRDVKPPGVRSSNRLKPVHLGIRSFEGWGKAMRDEADDVLELDEYFDGRTIFDPALWQTAILPKVREFLLRYADERRPLWLDFAAHATIAFAAGYCLEAKSGLDVRVSQRWHGGTSVWSPRDGAPPPPPLWTFEETKFPVGPDAEAVDVALAVSVTNAVRVDVERYLQESELEPGRLLAAAVPEPGQAAVANGAHALALAHQLTSKVQSRPLAERRGVLHLFTSAPNVFTFFLGQLAPSFGQVQLYEHGFGSGKVGDYQPSLHLPSSRMWGAVEGDPGSKEAGRGHSQRG